MKTRIETQVDFPGDLMGDPDLSGQNFPIVIAGYKGVMIMPQLQSDWKKSFSQIPSQASLDHPKSKLKYNNFDWGRTLSSNGISSFKACIICFEFNKNQHYKVAATKIARESYNYFDKMVLFLDIIAETTIRNDYARETKKIQPTFYTNYKGKVFNVSERFYYATAILPPSSGIQRKQISESIKYSNQNFDPNIAHKYICDARYALRNNDLRKSIIDTGTALEIALTRICEANLRKTNPQKYVDEILRKFKTLGGRLLLADILNFDLITTKNDVYKSIVEPRNKTIHQGIIHSRGQIENAVKIGGLIIKKHCSYYE